MMTAFIVSFTLATSYLLPLLQGKILSAQGSDNSTHVFLVNALRENNFQLFTQVPRIINPSYCGAFPLFLHLGLSRLSLRLLPGVARHLNPSLNLALCASVWLTLAYSLDSGLSVEESALAVALLATTPQYYHAFSARNSGISSRSLGIIFFFLFQILYVSAESQGFPITQSLSVIAFGYLIFAFNTFASQALVFTAINYSLWTNVWVQPVFVCIALLTFVIAHPRYGSSYLLHTLQFINHYRKELADVFILKRRYSIWRDLIRDIWIRFREQGLRRGGSYAYSNSVLIVIFLNPLTLIGGLGGFLAPPESALLEFSWRLAAISLLISVATSFRATRFLGEPERYVEIATPFGVIAGTYFLLENLGFAAAISMLFYQSLATISQFVVARRLRQHVAGNWTALAKMFDAVSAKIPPSDVRFSSNNDEIIKFALQQPWQFARHWSFEMPFAGLSVREAFEEYPKMYPRAFVEVITQYRVNAVVIDRSCWNASELNSTDFPEGFQKIYSDDLHAAYIRTDAICDTSIATATSPP